MLNFLSGFGWISDLISVIWSAVTGKFAAALTAIQVLGRNADPRHMMMQRDKIKNMILSRDRNFRSQASRLFADIAFLGEKIFFSTQSEVLATIKFDRFAQNLCIAPDNMVTADYLVMLDEINKAIAGTQIMVLAYFRLDQARDMQAVQAALSHLRLFLLPLKRPDFVATFRSTRPGAVEGFKPPVINLEASKTKSPPTKATPNAKTINFVEATQHVRESIEWANALLKDPAQIPTLLKIGQRFNGIAGTFLFLKSKPGYREVYQTAVIIDNLSRAYQNVDSAQELVVTRAHLDLLLATMKCAFTCLKVLRDGQELSEQLMAEVSAIQKLYSEFNDIPKRDEQAQDAVDELVERLRAG